MRFRTLLDVVAVWGLRLAVVLAAPLLVFTARTWHGRAVGVLAACLWSPIIFWVGVIGHNIYFQSTRFVNGVYVPPATVDPIEIALRVLATVGTLLLFAALMWVWVVPLFLLFTQPNFRSDTPGLRSVVLGPLFLHRWRRGLTRSARPVPTCPSGRG